MGSATTVSGDHTKADDKDYVTLRDDKPAQQKKQEQDQGEDQDSQHIDDIDMSVVDMDMGNETDFSFVSSCKQ